MRLPRARVRQRGRPSGPGAPVSVGHDGRGVGGRPAVARVYAFSRRWREHGLIAEFHDRPHGTVREREGREAEPTAGIFLPADALEEHLHRLGAGMAAGELLAVVSQHLEGNPVAAHRGGEGRAHRAGAGHGHGHGHDGGDHDEPGMVVDAGDHLALPPVGQRNPADQVHLPQCMGDSAATGGTCADAAVPGPAPTPTRGRPARGRSGGHPTGDSGNAARRSRLPPPRTRAWGCSAATGSGPADRAYPPARTAAAGCPESGARCRTVPRPHRSETSRAPPG